MSSSRKNRRGLALKLFLAAGIPLILASLVEFLVATLDIAPPAVNPIVVWNLNRKEELENDAGEFRFNRWWLWEPRPGAMIHGAAINQGCYRGPFYPEERSDRLRIAVMGDSSTYGFNLPERDGWGRVLESLLRDAGHDVEVLNFGVTGFTVVQGYRLYCGRVRNYRPDIVVAAFGAVNENFPARKGLTDEDKINLMSRPVNRLRTFLHRYATFRYLEHLLRREPREDGDPPEEAFTRRVTVPVFARCLEELHRAVGADHGRLVLVSPPRRADGEADYPGLLEYTKTIREVADRLAIPLADVYEAFRKQDREALGEEYLDPAAAERSSLFIDVWHPTRRGGRLYAAVVGLILQEGGLLKNE